MQVLQESEQFLDNQINSNKQLEDTIKKLEKKLSFTKDERLRISREIDAYQLELKAQTKALDDLGRQTRQMRADTKRKKTVIEKKRNKAEEMKKQIKEVKATLEDIGNQSLNVADRLKQLEDMIEVFYFLFSSSPPFFLFNNLRISFLNSERGKKENFDHERNQSPAKSNSSNVKSIERSRE